MGLVVLVGVACAILFHRAARYERMAPWAWTVASIGLTAIVALTGRPLTLNLIAQIALFVAMWWYNMRRAGKKPG